LINSFAIYFNKVMIY